MPHVFISYNQEEADFAGLLMMRLESAGFETWLDKNRLRGGNDWSQEIDQGILEAFALVVVMSPTAKASEYVTFEWSFALGAGIPVIPILRKPTDLHPRLNRLQYLKFTHDQPWEKLINELSDLQKGKNSGFQIPKDAPPYIRHSVDALDNANRADREAAIDSLADTDLPIATEALVFALAHPLRDVRFAASLALGTKADERAFPVAFDDMPRPFYLLPEDEQNKTLGKLSDAFRALRHASIPYLIKLLSSETPIVRAFALDTLGDLKAVEAIPHLAPFLEDGYSDLWDIRLVFGTLQEIGDESAMPLLVKAWDSSHTKNFNHIDEMQGAKYLIPIPQNFFALYNASIQFRSLELLPSLLKCLKSPYPHIVAYSLMILDYLVQLDGFDVNAVLPVLTGLLQRNDNIQMELFAALDLAPGRALPIFAPTGDIRQFGVRLCDFVAQTLDFIGKPEATNAVNAWRKGEGISTPFTYIPGGKVG
ncbi:TIR domain-containing protein [bacterium]|nr:MAG: TIR domain-containing protein [bacterium]